MKAKEIPQLLQSDLAAILGVSNLVVKINVYENSSSVQWPLEEFFANYNPEDIQKGLCNLMFRIDLHDETVASFSLRDMYNCSGLLVGSDLFVLTSYRHKGIGSLLTKFMMDFASHYGYGVLQATDISSNEHQNRIFEKLNWKASHSFVNPKTTHQVTMWLFNFQ